MSTMDISDIVIDFGKKYNFGRGSSHAFKVRDLALKIFDGTKQLGLHDMGSRKRLWLEIAALLHDIGVSAGGEHHESSRNLILSSKELRDLLGSSVLEAIAWISFFHRSKPNPLKYSDPEWREHLKSKYGSVVIKLAAILRIADALDRSLTQVVDDVKLKMSNDKLLIEVFSEEDVSVEVERAREKAQLFEDVFNVMIEVRQVL